MFTGFAQLRRRGLHADRAARASSTTANSTTGSSPSTDPSTTSSGAGSSRSSGSAVTHDSGRTVTMIVWVLAEPHVRPRRSWRMTRSVVIGHRRPRSSPSTSLDVAHQRADAPGRADRPAAGDDPCRCSAFVGERESPYALALLGAVAAAALVLVKINVGAFAVHLGRPGLRGQLPGAVASGSWPRSAIEALFVGVPILLMSEQARA